MSPKAKRLFWVATICTLAAIATHFYLTDHHYSLKYGEATSEGICNINSTMNCTKTTQSDFSEFLGIPVAIFGGLINLAFLLFLLGYRYPIVNRETQIKLGSTLKLMSLGIFAVSLIMGFISYVLLQTICPACTTAYVLSLISFASTWTMVSDNRGLFTSLDIKLYPITLAAVFCLAFITHKDYMKSNNADEKLEILQLQIEQWKNSPAKTVTPAQALVMNPNPSAKMKIVEFADFLCGHCAKAYPVIHKFVKSHPDVEFSFQAWPLDGECNTSISQAEGTRCLLARVSQCAGEQQKEWATQEWIFSNQRYLLSKDQVMTQLQANSNSLGLDHDKLMSCVESDAAREAIRQQAKVGSDLNLRGTPSLWINGKKVPGGFSVLLLNRIYKEINQGATKN